MTSPSDSDDAASPAYVVCASCGAKASISWSFCRSCDSSLEDALPADEARQGIRTENAPNLGPCGCPKCGHEDAEVDTIATTGTGLSKLFDLQNRRFSVVSCINCGYSEFYRDSDADTIVDFFLGG